jgi:hypothetical protein
VLAYDHSGVRSYLVVANQTLGGEHLTAKVQECLAAGPCRFHLVVPVTLPSGHAWTEGEVRAAADVTLQAALDRFRRMGAEADGEIGDSNPMLAIEDAMLERSFDEIILSTLPPGPSRWLKLDLPRRVAARFPIPVSHIVGEAPTE